MNSHPKRARPLPLIDWMANAKADDLRFRKRLRRFAIAGLGIGLLLGSAIFPPPPLLVWNASPSAPMGLYRLSPNAPILIGDVAVTWVPPVARQLAAQRHYLPSNVPLVKQVAAVEGDFVCAIGPDITVNGKWIAARLDRDGKGRTMPWWTGCLQLWPGELFLIATDQPQAFDGRYFGITRAEYVVGKAVLLWRR